MSLATFKKKSVTKYSSATKHSAASGGYWLSQGPFGNLNSTNSVIFKEALKQYGAIGFSLAGPYRSISVGKDMKFSQQGTRFKGQYPVGHGGTYGKYFEADPMYNAGLGMLATRGTQWQYVKPSSVNTKGMLTKKYKWAYSGQYPNYWVQPVYNGFQTETKSQGMYLHTKSAGNDCVTDINNPTKYIGHRVNHGPFGCRVTPAKGYKMNIAQSNAPYTKRLGLPEDSSQRTLRIQRQCANPSPSQKPFPYAVQTGSGILTGGIRISNVGNSGAACNSYTPNFLTPPNWYTASKPK